MATPHDPLGMRLRSPRLGCLSDVGKSFLNDAIALANDYTFLRNKAKDAPNAGKGAAYGSKVHSAFGDLVSKVPGLNSEISYLNGSVVAFGTKGSIRADVVLGDVQKPKAIYDLKTGGAALTQKRIAQIRRNLPKGSQNIPILLIRPTK